jgi:hypothetical protein
LGNSATSTSFFNDLVAPLGDHLKAPWALHHCPLSTQTTSRHIRPAATVVLSPIP